MITIELEIDHTFVGSSTFVVFKDGRERRALRAQRGLTYQRGQLAKVQLDQQSDQISWPS